MLASIVEAARGRSEALDEAALRRAAGASAPARPFAAALSGDGLSVVAEIKRRSPSAGVIAASLDPAAQAAAYVAGGAAAISVLTEPDHFSGSLDDLAAVRDSVAVPVLRKDFTVSPSQVWEARAAGADAVLLIVAVLDDASLADLLATAAEAGVDALVEVHDELECERALRAGAVVVGVNNRDLTTFTTDLSVAERLSALLEDVPVRIAESGIDGPDAAARMARAGYQAALVGEALVRADDPGSLVAAMTAAGRVTA